MTPEHFATQAHKGQVRKYTGDPYIVHPGNVVDLIRTVPHTQAMIDAAWLHDVVEDREVPIEEVAERFGYAVAKIVHELTDPVFLSGNRAARKQATRLRLSQASWEAQTIKCADLIDNLGSIVENDPAFAEVYVTEKLLLLPVLTAADRSLWQRAEVEAHYARNRLGMDQPWSPR